MRIDDTELPTLHAHEGLGEGYEFERVEVLRGDCGLRTFAYRAVESHIDEGLQPFDWYKSLVVAGAREHELPELYIEMLEQIAAVEDADVVRARKNLEHIDSAFAS